MSCEFENFQDDCFWKPRGAIKWSHANWGTRQGGTGPDNYFGRELYSTSGGNKTVFINCQIYTEYFLRWEIIFHKY